MPLKGLFMSCHDDDIHTNNKNCSARNQMGMFLLSHTGEDHHTSDMDYLEE